MSTDLLFDWLDLKKSMSMYLRAMLLRPQDTELQDSAYLNHIFSEVARGA